MAGVPVQPVVIQHPFEQFSPTWESVPCGWPLFQLFTQLRQHVRIIYCPLHRPTPEEQHNPLLFGSHVAEEMAEASGMPLSSSSFEHKLRLHRLVRSGVLSWRWFENDADLERNVALIAEHEIAV